MSRAPADQRRRAAALPFLQSDLQSSLGFRVSRVTARAFVVEAIDAIMDENGLLQGHRGYRNPTLSVGDQLVAVEGYDAEEMEYNTPGSIQAVFKGPRGSCVELTFLSEKTGDEFNIRVKRHVVDQLVRATKDQAKPGSSCGVGVLLGRPYNQDDFHDVTVLDLVDGGSAQRSGKIDIGDVRKQPPNISHHLPLTKPSSGCFLQVS